MLIPFNQPQRTVFRLIELAKVDFVVAAAGSLPVLCVQRECSKVKEVIQVVEPASRHVGWEQEGSAVWHEIVEKEIASATADLPQYSTDDQVPKDMITIWLNEDPSSFEIIALTHKVCCIY